MPHTPPRMPGAFCLNAGLRSTMTVDFARSVLSVSKFCFCKNNKRSIIMKVTEPSSVCVACLIGKQKKPILFSKVTEPSSIPYRTHSACAKRAAYPDPPPVIPLPDTGVAQAAYAETLLPGSAPARNVFRYWGSPRACYRIPCCE